MIQSLITIIIPMAAGKVDDVNKVLDTLGKPLHLDIAELARGDRPFVHFMSVVAIPAPDYESREGPVDFSIKERIQRALLWPFTQARKLRRWMRPPKAHVVIELNADGIPKEAVCKLAGAIPGPLLKILHSAGHANLRADGLSRFLRKRCHTFAPPWLSKPGLLFAGTPDMSVRRILAEDKLAIRIQELVDQTYEGSALRRLWWVRREIFLDDHLKEAFVSEPVKNVAGEAQKVSILMLVYIGLRQFGWPLLVLPTIVFAYVLYAEYSMYGTYNVTAALWPAFLITVAEVLATGWVAWRGYKALRQSEEDDVPFDEEPAEKVLDEILNREDTGGVQNHLAAVSTMKPGWFRGVTLRGALWLIGESGAKRSQPGFIDKIGTIHFARWFRIPWTNQLIFLSNYDGSWQSYLEDFIARLREGLSSVWSNTYDFPKTTNLIDGGAADGARFKRWARRQQIPTRLWFTGYPPYLTTDRIRANARIRHGFASASTEDEAAKWLSLFGYAARESLELSEIPALAFGGQKELGHAQCLLIDLGNSGRASNWLHSIKDEIAYGDVPAKRPLVTGFTRSGLEKLGLEEPALATFPIAFQQGMHAVGRARALGDDPKAWAWGNGDVDAILMVYAADASSLDAAVAKQTSALLAFGARVVTSIATEPLKQKVDEPFGFRDGISQPVVGGTLKASRERNLANIVKPGEMVLGYRDNLDIVAPVPQALGQDIGRNGTYLVVRQLDQDKVKFEAYLDAEADQYIKDKDVRPPTLDRDLLRHWIAAKMVGRWKDGSSLVRNPLGPATAKDPKAAPDNRFMYGHEDPDGLRCPLGSHIRRANPRDSFEAGSAKAIEISNRHRILRVGRTYHPPGGKRGLLFMCVNADIERQFEFLQQSWILGPNFHGLANEVDPIVGCGKDRGMTVPTPNGPMRLKALADFVSMRGGGYFFLPSLSTVKFLTRNVGPKPFTAPWVQSTGYA